MQEKIQQINFSEISKSALPLAFKNIHVEKLPPLAVEKKLTVLNRKYNFSTMQVNGADKPISKII